MNEMKSAKPVNLSFTAIEEIADKFATKVNYTPDGDLHKIVKSLRGVINNKSVVDTGISSISEIGVTPDNDPNFIISLAPFSFPLLERYAIAHELGHFCLHSEFGEKELEAPNNHAHADLVAEQEAGDFAQAFLIPKSQLDTFLEGKKEVTPQAVAAKFRVPVNLAISRMRNREYR